jgi:hypothetical protein
VISSTAPSTALEPVAEMLPARRPRSRRRIGARDRLLHLLGIAMIGRRSELAPVVLGYVRAVDRGNANPMRTLGV